LLLSYAAQGLLKGESLRAIGHVMSSTGPIGLL
jgi:hypothetical protein